MNEYFVDKLTEDYSGQIDRAIGFLWYLERIENKDAVSTYEVAICFDRARLNRPNTTRLSEGMRKHVLTRKVGPYKIALTNEGMKRFDKDYKSLFIQEKAGDLFEETNLLEFPFMEQSDILDARRMSSLYVNVFFLENSMRRFIEKTLHAELGPDWWTATASSSMLKKEFQRRQNEIDNKWIPARSSIGPLYSLDWSDLITIMRKQEIIFKSKLGNIDFLHRFSDLANLRNVIAHNGIIEGEAHFKRIEVAIHDWQQQLRKS
jgi:hypothetical protein